jgi:hypothetical protein
MIKRSYILHRHPDDDEQDGCADQTKPEFPHVRLPYDVALNRQTNCQLEVDFLDRVNFRTVSLSPCPILVGRMPSFFVAMSIVAMEVVHKPASTPRRSEQ